MNNEANDHIFKFKRFIFFFLLFSLHYWTDYKYLWVLIIRRKCVCWRKKVFFLCSNRTGSKECVCTVQCTDIGQSFIPIYGYFSFDFLCEIQMPAKCERDECDGGMSKREVKKKKLLLIWFYSNKKKKWEKKLVNRF